jgi:hypothetical protein
MLMSATGLVALYNGNWVLNRIISDSGRFMAGLMILDLHFTQGDGAGFTITQLRREAEAHGFGSPGRMTALVATLRLLGFLRGAEAGDRRRKLLVPTEAFFELHRNRMRSMIEALAVLHPEVAVAIVKLGNPRFLARLAQGFLIRYRLGVRVFELSAPLRPFTARDAGLVVLLSLLIAEMEGQPISITAMARQFSVSRTHVLMILKEAENACLAIQDRKRTTYRATHGLIEAMRHQFATLFAYQRDAVDYALKRANEIDTPTDA